MTDVALRFGATDDGLTAQFRRVGQQLASFEREASRTGSVAAGAFGNLGKIIAGVSLVALTREVAQFAGEMKDAAERTGIAIDSIQRLNFIAGQTGAEFGRVTGAVNRLQLSLVSAGEGSAQAAQALGRLGIPVENFINLAPDQQFERVARQIAAIENPAERATAAIGLFGRSGADLLPTLLATGKEIDNLDQTFASIGGPVGADAIDAVDSLGDTLSATVTAAKSLGVELLAIASPIVVKGINLVNESLGLLRFGLGGFEGSNEVVNLSNQIDDLTGKALAFKNAINPEGQRRFAELSAEIETLQRQLDALTETGSFIAPTLQNAVVDVSSIVPPQINFPQTGTPQPTPEDLRNRAGLADTSPFNQLNVEQFELQEVANQEHLDRLLEQQRVYAQNLVLTGEESASALALLRQEYGIQEINFEELKSATIQDIQQSLATSGLQIATALFGQNKKVALAVAAINIGVGATEALKLPFPANLAAVAKVIAQGAQLTQRIRSANIGGGGGFGGVSSGGVGSSTEPAAAAAPTGVTERSATNIYINGVVDRRVIDQLVGAMRDEMDRDVVIIPGNSRQAIELRGE
jgi:hypothetical protein